MCLHLLCSQVCALPRLLHIKPSKEIMPKDPKKMMKEAFDKFTGGGEFMNASQLAQCLSRNDTTKISKQAAQEIINEFDKDGDGLLSFEEFMDAMADM